MKTLSSKKRLRVAMFCTNEWPTPPPQNTFYAPLWIAHSLAEGIAKKGHDVYYFGAKESRVKAHLITLNMVSLKKNKRLLPYLKTSNEKVVNFYEQMMISKIYEMALKGSFDIIHIHPYRRAIQYASLSKTPTVFTLHDPIEDFNKYMLLESKRQKSTYCISISNAQRRGAPQLNYIQTVYNGLDVLLYPWNNQPKNHFVAAGRFVPEKGIDIAVRVARAAKINLKIAGGQSSGNYWDRNIKPYLGKKIRYVGMLPYHRMGDFYKEGQALLYPLRWEEPFGLVMVEAMACGTPVIAFRHGSVPEIVKNGVSGFIVNTIPEMVRATKKIKNIDRKKCREWVEKRFTVQTMVDGYEKAYYKILERENKK